VAKTASGKKAAAKASCFFKDLDQYIEESEEKSISQMFETEGETIFREKERYYLKRLTEKCINSDSERCLISCGGGTPCFGNNHAYMQQKGKTIFLNTPFSVILIRLIHANEKRPMTQKLSPEEIESKMRSLYNQRLPEYQKADFTLSELPPKVIIQLQNLIQME
jgi:shikimate kinase